MGGNVEINGDVVGWVICFGRSFALFNIFEISSKTLRVLSPACNDGVVVDGELMRMLIISFAACLRKSSRCNSGKEIALENNVTVLESLLLLDLGKQHQVHL